MKYIIDVEDTPVNVGGVYVYKAKQFNTLVFDQTGLDKLKKYDSEEELENARHGVWRFVQLAPKEYLKYKTFKEAVAAYYKDKAEKILPISIGDEVRDTDGKLGVVIFVYPDNMIAVLKEDDIIFVAPDSVKRTGNSHISIKLLMGELS